MTLSTDIKALELDIRAAGARVDDVLKEAGVARTTWTRWKNGDVTGARYDKITRVRAAVESAMRRSAAA